MVSVVSQAGSGLRDYGERLKACKSPDVTPMRVAGLQSDMLHK